MRLEKDVLEIIQIISKIKNCEFKVTYEKLSSQYCIEILNTEYTIYLQKSNTENYFTVVSEYSFVKTLKISFKEYYAFYRLLAMKKEQL